jgi:hypothetical protein
MLLNKYAQVNESSEQEIKQHAIASLLTTGVIIAVLVYSSRVALNIRG